MYDLAKLISHIYKHDTIQDQSILYLLDTYQEYFPLSSSDKYWILTYINYPHDIWKLIYIYYLVKNPQELKDIEYKYNQLLKQQEKSDGLYQTLYTYFNL